MPSKHAIELVLYFRDRLHKDHWDKAAVEGLANTVQLHMDAYADERERERYGALLEAALKLEPQIGWHGDGVYSRDEFYCELCDAHDPCDASIPHKDGCPIPAFRAALEAVRKEKK